MKRGVPASIHLLGEHQPHNKKLALSYLMSSWKTPLLRNPLGHLPQAFKQKQGRFYGIEVNEDRACVVCQTGGNRCMIAVRQTNDEVRIWTSPDADELHALIMQGVMRMRDCHPFLRWVVKGGSVL
jgi:hypothetical protein